MARKYCYGERRNSPPTGVANSKTARLWQPPPEKRCQLNRSMQHLANLLIRQYISE